MNILILSSSFPVSASDYTGCFVMEQARALASLGHQVTVLAQYPRYIWSRPSLNSFRSRECIDDVLILRSSFFMFLPRVPFGSFVIQFLVTLFQFFSYVLCNGIPDVFHGHNALFGGASAVILGFFCRKPSIITEHSSSYFLNLVSSWEKCIARLSFVFASRLIVVSTSLGSDIQKSCRFTRSDIVVLPNVVSERFFRQPISILKSTENLSFVSIGSFDTNKNHKLAIESFAKLSPRNPSYTLCLVGAGPQDLYLKDLVLDLRLSSSVKFVPTLPPADIPCFLAGFSVLLVTSFYETFSLVAAEALALGIPVVSTKCSGPLDFITDKSGIISSSWTVDAYADAINMAVNTYHKFLPAALRCYARSLFGPDIVASKLELLYKEFHA